MKLANSGGGIDEETNMRMPEPMKMLAWLVVLATGASALTACNTIEGAGKDVSATGRAIQNTADDAKPK